MKREKGPPHATGSYCPPCPLQSATCNHRVTDPPARPTSAAILARTWTCTCSGSGAGTRSGRWRGRLRRGRRACCSARRRRTRPERPPPTGDDSDSAAPCATDYAPPPRARCLWRRGRGPLAPLGPQAMTRRRPPPRIRGRGGVSSRRIDPGTEPSAPRPHGTSQPGATPRAARAAPSPKGQGRGEHGVRLSAPRPPCPFLPWGRPLRRLRFGRPGRARARETGDRGPCRVPVPATAVGRGLRYWPRRLARIARGRRRRSDTDVGARPHRRSAVTAPVP